GLPELNIHGETGFACNVGDIDDMTEKALYILDDANLETFKHNALERAKKFDVQNILPIYESMYRRVFEEVTGQVAAV
ncbi:MAG: N-acetyl-alpha-D-glucosaminyl L-malate synthase BshA, partial [Cyclobacteriaceae bacterium]